MAETGFTVHAGGAATDGGADGGERTTRRPSRPAEAKTVVDFLGLAAVATKLRQEGEQFVSNVVTEAAKYDIELKVTKILGDNYEARVLTHGGLAVALIFHETFARRDMSRIPSVSVTKDVIRQFELKGGTEKIIQVLVVFKEMYEAYEQVAAGIVNSFRAEDDTTYKNLTIGDFDASGELHVSTNLKDALAFAATTTGSPIAHCDSALLLYAKRRDPNKSGYGVGDDTTNTPIAVVTGYTDLKRVPADMYRVNFKYDPTFVITGIYSPIRTKQIAAVMIAICSDYMIQRGLWLGAFSNFGEGERNFGNLFLDPKTKKPYSCKNIQEREAIMQQHFTSKTPLLAIDLQEGCDQFPGLKEFISNPDAIKACIKDFTGDERCAQFDVMQGEAIQYDGIVETLKGRVDTRAVDFLFLVDPKGAGVSHDRAAPLLDYPDPQDPRAIEKRALLLEEFYNADKIDLAYTTHRMFFNPDFVAALAAGLCNSIHLISDSWVSNQVYDLSGLRRFAPNAAPAFSAGGGFGGGFAGFRGFAY